MEWNPRKYEEAMARCRRLRIARQTIEHEEEDAHAEVKAFQKTEGFEIWRNSRDDDDDDED